MQPCQISLSLIDIHIYKGIASQHLVIKMFLDEQSACKGLIGSGIKQDGGEILRERRERREKQGAAARSRERIS